MNEKPMEPVPAPAPEPTPTPEPTPDRPGDIGDGKGDIVEP